MGRESGGAAPMLSGLQGKLGRSSGTVNVNLAAAAWVQIMESNPTRSYAVIRMSSAVGTKCFLNFDSSFVGGIPLYNDDIWVIDDNHPWTGAVFAYLNAAGLNGESVDVLEVQSASL